VGLFWVRGGQGANVKLMQAPFMAPRWRLTGLKCFRSWREGDFRRQPGSWASWSCCCPGSSPWQPQVFYVVDASLSGEELLAGFAAGGGCCRGVRLRNKTPREGEEEEEEEDELEDEE